MQILLKYNERLGRCAHACAPSPCCQHWPGLPPGNEDVNNSTIQKAEVQSKSDVGCDYIMICRVLFPFPEVEVQVGDDEHRLYWQPPATSGSPLQQATIE
eukprot:scaffold209019_cov37-Prasinocladus_malaysianus.AAC.1